MKSGFLLEHNDFDEPRKMGNFMLYQIGRRHLSAGESVGEHTHRDFLELTVVDSGEGTVVTNGETHEVRAGDIYVSFPGDFHAIVANKKSTVRYDFLAFSSQDERLRPEVEWLLGAFYSPDMRVIHDATIPRLVTVLTSERTSGEPYCEFVSESLLCEVLCRLLRAFRKKVSTRRPTERSGESALCYEIMNYIDAHIYHIRSLSEVAEALNYNYNYLSNLYRRVTGETLLDYYRHRRLKTARLLLSEEGAAVSKVSALLGYSSLYTFSRAFKEMYGVPPSRAKDMGSREDADERRNARAELIRAEEAIRDVVDVVSFESK